MKCTTPKLTRQKARGLYPKIYKACYCALQFAGVSERNRVGYNCGVFGWNWDLIPIGNGVAVCTGYRGMIGEPFPKWFADAIEPLEREYYRAFNAHEIAAADNAAKEAAALVL